MHLILVAFFICVFSGVIVAQTNQQTTNSRRCLGPNREYGFCVHAARCPLPEFKKDKLLFMDHFCVIDRLYIGICCPDSFLFQSQLGTTLVGNPGALGHGGSSNTGQESIQLLPVQAQPEPPVKPKPPVAEPSPQRSGCGLNEKMDVGRVTAGRPADPKEWPWMAAIMIENTQFCGGCLITERHILTAAHCVIQYKPGQIYVRLGEHNFKRFDETRTQNLNVTDIKRHKDFDSITYENDIAILKLERAALFNSYVWPACLPELGNSFAKEIAFVIGWGSMQFGGKSSDTLMEVSVPVWENEECSNYYVQPIEPYHLCAGGQGGKDSCQGDSGGPLLYQLENRRWVTIGVVSWGIRCGEDRPAIYTRVNRYLDWIVRSTL